MVLLIQLLLQVLLELVEVVQVGHVFTLRR